MPKVKISEYSATANSNTDVASINIDEGCAPSGINNAIRAVMGHLKDFQQGTYGDPFNGPHNGTVGATTPSTGAFTTLTASGNVGVGGTTNSYGSQTTLTLSGTNVSRIDFRSNSTFTGTILSYQAVTEGLRLQTETGYPITFYPAGTKAATIDTAGNLGLGVTPSASWSAQSAFQVNARSAFAGSSNFTAVSTNAIATTAGWGANYLANGTAALYTQSVSTGAHQWYTAASGTAGNAISFTQAMTLDASGNLLVGKTSAGNNFNGAQLSPTTQFFTNTNDYIALFNRKGTDGVSIYFQKDETNVGNISVTTSATAYNTSSDYRLKNTITPMTGALVKVALLKPCTYKWNADGSDGEGFIAHELAEVCPHAVTGAKDAVDAEGKPQYQGIDVSFLVATLTAAIQELKAEFDAYKASHP